MHKLIHTYCVCIHECVYIYIYVYIHSHTDTNTHEYMHAYKGKHNACYTHSWHSLQGEKRTVQNMLILCQFHFKSTLLVSLLFLITVFNKDAKQR